MGLFEKIFTKKQITQKVQNTFKMLNGYEPVFTNWNASLYELDTIRSSIETIARQCSKLNIEVIGKERSPQLVAQIKKAPNKWMSWSKFFARVATILNMQNTCFIVPQFDLYGRVNGFYPVLPERCKVVEYQNVEYLQYQFSNGKSACVELNKCGILTAHQYMNDLFGETNRALIPTAQLIDIYNQGIKEGVRSSATYRFMAQASTILKDEDLKRQKQEFNAQNFAAESKGGLLLFPSTYRDIKQIESKPYIPSSETKAQIDKNVYSYFGVNEKILQSSANDEELDSFYNCVIEPFAIQLSEELTRMFFTYGEIVEGSELYVGSNRLQYMSVSHKIAMAQQLGDRGMMTPNEIRALFNLPPLENGDIPIIRGEYYSTKEKLGEDNENNSGKN